MALPGAGILGHVPLYSGLRALLAPPSHSPSGLGLSLELSVLSSGAGCDRLRRWEMTHRGGGGVPSNGDSGEQRAGVPVSPSLRAPGVPSAAHYPRHTRILSPPARRGWPGHIPRPIRAVTDSGGWEGMEGPWGSPAPTLFLWPRAPGFPKPSPVGAHCRVLGHQPWDASPPPCATFQRWLPDCRASPD